jgi:hypothetical protein
MTISKKFNKKDDSIKQWLETNLNIVGIKNVWIPKNDTVMTCTDVELETSGTEILIQFRSGRVVFMNWSEWFSIGLMEFDK